VFTISSGTNDTNLTGPDEATAMMMFWGGRGIWLPIMVAVAMFLPIIVLRQVDGPEIDHGVGITMAIAAVIVFALGWRWNEATPRGERAHHSFMGLPLQYWAVPMLIFAVLLGTRTITTEETPSVHPASPEAYKAAGKPRTQ
jgi:drug/metabolite transporter (DMT)-like permease